MHIHTHIHTYIHTYLHTADVNIYKVHGSPSNTERTTISVVTDLLTWDYELTTAWSLSWHISGWSWPWTARDPPSPMCPCPAAPSVETPLTDPVENGHVAMWLVGSSHVMVMRLVGSSHVTGGRQSCDGHVTCGKWSCDWWEAVMWFVYQKKNVCMVVCCMCVCMYVRMYV